ncbi:MAG: hypothetical protein JSU09_04340 [Bacteroidetes bacterium]|nr:hypothetical protein [Bacteroidota bacterium]
MRNTLIMLGLITLSLLIGTIGYRFTGGFTWMDSFLNSAMILTGMGPVHDPVGNGGKFFSAMFALYSGIIFLSAVAIFIFPILKIVMSVNLPPDAE